MSRAGVDIGGTFTDLVLADDDGLRVVKVPSTSDPSEGMLRALGRLSEAPSEVAHGTTVATNAVIERRGARLGFVATQGFRHILHLARQDRPSLYDLRATRPSPLVDRDRCVGAAERIGPDGAVELELDEPALRSALVSLRDAEAVAVVLLHSYANAVHEHRVAEIIRSELPGVDVSCSSDVLSEMREYERASTTALNAYVQPVLARYLRRLEASIGSRLSVMWSGGGLRDVASSVATPVHTLLSGPAAGVLAGAWAARQTGSPDAVTLDMGGTSADVGIVEDGEPLVAEESALDGLPFKTPCIDVVSVGAGGGSVAWIDEGGALRVGPRSAGASPGPAAYGKGGSEPTVTDAHVVLSHLGDELAGGELALDAAAASLAVEGLGLGLRAGAEGILRVARATMTRAIRSVSIERGKDVRDYALVAFGGAGPLHAVAVARELGMQTVVVPVAPGALAALGLLVASRRADASVSRPIRAAPENDVVLRDTLAELERSVVEELAAEETPAAELSFVVDCRYRGQSHEVRVPVEDQSFDAVVAGFHRAHRERFGFSRENVEVEAVTFRATAHGSSAEVSIDSPAVTRKPEKRATRGGVPVYAREDLPAGWGLKGPAIISSLDSTTWVEEGASAEVHTSGALVISP